MVSPKDTYVSRTNPDPYDQIIVLSQKVINAGFKIMWQLAQADDDSPLKHFKKSIHGQYIDADVGIPSVKLHVGSKEPMLYFLLSLTKGKLSVYESDESDDTIDWDIKDWVLAFNVAINQKQVAKDSEEYKRFKDRASLPESDFSLAQLFIDSASSTSFNRDQTTFGEHSLDQLTAAASASIIEFINHWVTVMHESGSSILGYSAQREQGTNELNQYAPSFPPTGIDYSTYPWRGDDGSGPDKDDQDQNALSYLMVSDFRNLPSEGAIPYTGAWVDGDSRGALFCMSRTLFWEWLLPVMREVVKAMTPIPETPYVVYNGTPPDMPYATADEWHIGDTSAPDDDYKWVPSGQATWKATSPRKATSNRATDTHDPTDYEDVSESSDKIEATVSFDAGREAINLSGSNTFRYQIDHQRTKYDPTHFWVEVYTNWSLQIDMASIEEGGIIFQIPNEHTIEVTHDYGGDLKMGNLPQTIASNISNELQNSMTTALDGVEDRLLYALANANRLCLPAAGTFFMKDPIFNHQGDLLVKLTYDGAEPPAPPRKGQYKLRPKILEA